MQTVYRHTQIGFVIIGVFLTLFLIMACLSVAVIFLLPDVENGLLAFCERCPGGLSGRLCAPSGADLP